MVSKIRRHSLKLSASVDNQLLQVGQLYSFFNSVMGGHGGWS
jgi:hypothetical protein